MSGNTKNIDRMTSPALKELAESIATTGEAIKRFQEDISLLRAGKASSKGESATSAAFSTGTPTNRHAELIQALMDNMDEIKHLAKCAVNRNSLPIRPESMGEFGIRNMSLLISLNEVPQTQIVTATRSKLNESEGLLRNMEQLEKLIQ